MVDDAANAVGTYSAAAIGADGFPVISYLDETSTTLRLMRCNDAACAGGDESIDVVDGGALGMAGHDTSLGIGPLDGKLIIACRDATNTAL